MRTLRRSAALLVVALVAVGSSLATMALAGGGQTFSDVPGGHPFHDEIEWLADSGITTGYPDGTFRPGQPVTRQAMAAYLQRLHAGISTHRNDVAFVSPTNVWGATVDCPAGKRAVAGGGAVNTAHIHLTDSRLEADGSGWTARWESDDRSAVANVTVTAYVTCVPATPAG